MLQLSGKNCWCLGLILIAIFAVPASGLRINEVELNPQGSSDSGNEWTELYSNTQEDLSNWIIMNSNGKNMSFNASFSGYYTINTTYTLLTDVNQKLFLINSNNSIIYETPVISDSYNDNRSWQYCDSNWTFAENTPGLENSCPNSCIQNWSCSGWSSCTNSLQTRTCQDLNNCNNETGKPSQSQSCTNSGGISLKLEYNEEIKNGGEFYVTAQAYNLENYDYDIKIFLTFKENDTIISQSYYENESKWMSGTYFINNIISGQGNKSTKIKLRINSEYKNFKGQVKINGKMRITGEANSVADFQDYINIAEKETNNANIILNNEENENAITSQAVANNTRIIKLNENIEGKDIKSPEIWKSNTQYIKEYAVYGFSLFCVFIIIFLLIKRK